MPPTRRRTPLDSVPLFAQTSHEQRLKIEAAGVRRVIRKGRYVFRAGQPPAGLHVLLSGRLKSVRELPGGTQILMHFVQPGDVFGEVPALLAENYRVSALAVEDSEVFTLPLGAFTRLMAADPESGLLFMRSMAGKLSILLDRIELQKCPRTEQRIARSLLSRRTSTTSTASKARPARASVVLTLRFSKKLWAEELGLQPESLSRGLRRLTEEGLIQVRGRDILLLDPPGLARVAAGGETGRGEE